MESLPVGVEDPHRLVFHQLTGNVGQRSSVWNYDDDAMMIMIMMIMMNHDYDNHDYHDMKMIFKFHL